MEESLIKDQFLNEKERLIELFFKIGSSEQITALQHCKQECKNFLKKEYDEEIEDLTKIITALIIYFKTDNREKAKEHVIDVWYKLYSKTNLSFNDIRLLNCLMFVEADIEALIELSEELLTQLEEQYKFHSHYLRLKITINSNLLDLLLDAKFLNRNYKDEFDQIIFKKVREVITLNLKHKLNDDYLVGRAIMCQGITLKDEVLIYTGCLLLRNSKKDPLSGINELIKAYIKKYNIEI